MSKSVVFNSEKGLARLFSQNTQWQQTMMRIKDPGKTIPFYENNFGLKLVHSYNFDDFSLYFMGTPMNNINYSNNIGIESEKLLWNYPGVLLEFTHNHGSENNNNFKINNGNIEPNRGFGHIAFNCNDVYNSCNKLFDNGVEFKKKPDDGMMKGLAFALDPDGYWVEVIKRNEPTNIEYNLSQTMMRIKDPHKSIPFYTQLFGMEVVHKMDVEAGKFTNYFLSSHGKGNGFHPVLELTHNWGTENDDNFSYHNGNDEPQGFGHIGFLVDDLNETCDILENQCNVVFKKRPNDGKMRGIAFVYDPDGYWVEIIQRGVQFL